MGEGRVEMGELRGKTGELIWEKEKLSLNID